LEVANAAEHAVAQVRMKRVPPDPRSAPGIRFAKQYLEELRNILEKELKPEAALRVSSKAQARVSVFQQELFRNINSISLHERKLVYFDSQFAQDKGNMDDQLRDYLVLLCRVLGRQVTPSRSGSGDSRGAETARRSRRLV